MFGGQAGGVERPFIEEEFVGRERAREVMLKVARQETPKRLLLLVGAFGMGKTWLLHKLEHDEGDAGIDAVLVDLAVPPLGKAEWGYLEIVEELRRALEGETFAGLDETIARAREESAKLGIADAFATQAGGAGGAPAQTQAQAAGDVSVAARVGDVGEGAQVAVGSQITMAQGDVTQFVVNQVVQGGDEALLSRFQAEITDAFREGLETLLSERKVTFVFDSWLKASGPTRDWLLRSLLSWILEPALENVAAVLADDTGIPELQQRHPRIHPLPLERLDEGEVTTYWVDRRLLQPEMAPMALQMSQGHPLTLAMIADQQDQSGGL